MSRTLRIPSCTLLLVVWATLAQPGQSPSAPPVRRANPGEAATGEVASETEKEIRINSRPCDANKAIVTFSKPYSKEAAGTIKCGKVEKPLVQVVQR